MRRARHLLVAVVVLSCYGTVVRAAEIGSAGALFLRLGVGGRASGMGEAYTAVAKDASAVYWNPGAMAAVLGTHFLFMHDEYLQSIRLEQLAISHETDWGTFGLSFTGVYMDEMDRYEDVPSAIPLGTFTAWDASFGVAYSRYIIPNLSAGVTAKLVYENIDESTANGFAFDAGLYHISRIPGVKFAAVIANLGKPIKFEDDNFQGQEVELPRAGKLGASYEKRFSAIDTDVLATFDLVLPNDDDARQHIGLELGYLERVFVRGGFKGGYDSQGPTFGAGIAYREFFVDYAVLFFDNDLGDSHRFSLALRF